MKFMYGVYDNVLTMEERSNLYTTFFERDDMMVPTRENRELYPSVWIEKQHIHVNPIFSKLASLISNHCDLTNATGYEFWTHNLSGVGFHYDKDELFYRRTGHTVMPLGTLVYYLEIINYDGNIHDGRYTLSTQDVIILPKDNRCVYMAPGQIHGGGGTPGVRRLLVLSPWVTKPIDIPNMFFN